MQEDTDTPPHLPSPARRKRMKATQVFIYAVRHYRLCFSAISRLISYFGLTRYAGTGKSAMAAGRMSISACRRSSRLRFIRPRHCIDFLSISVSLPLSLLRQHGIFRLISIFFKAFQKKPGLPVVITKKPHRRQTHAHACSFSYG